MLLLADGLNWAAEEPAPHHASARWHRHKDSAQRLNNHTYTSPVTPGFKRCQVLINPGMGTPVALSVLGLT